MKPWSTGGRTSPPGAGQVVKELGTSAGEITPAPVGGSRPLSGLGLYGFGDLPRGSYHQI